MAVTGGMDQAAGGLEGHGVRQSACRLPTENRQQIHTDRLHVGERYSLLCIDTVFDNLPVDFLQKTVNRFTQTVYMLEKGIVYCV